MLWLCVLCAFSTRESYAIVVRLGEPMEKVRHYWRKFVVTSPDHKAEQRPFKEARGVAAGAPPLGLEKQMNTLKEESVRKQGAQSRTTATRPFSQLSPAVVVRAPRPPTTFPHN